MLQKNKIINFYIHSGLYTQFVNAVLELGRVRVSSYVCFGNVHMTIEAFEDSDFLSLVNNADIAAPDGIPIAKAMKTLYGLEQERIAGMDFMPDLMEHAEENKMSIFLYGSTEKVLEKIIEKSKKDFPTLNICGAYSPPFRVLKEEEKKLIIEKINSVNPNFVFVALGCPKQEKWMAENKGKINSCMLGFGAAFNIYSGTLSRAPLWVRKYYLEWIYRVLQEPRRLFWRYFKTNIYFGVLILKQIIEVKVFKIGKKKIKIK